MNRLHVVGRIRFNGSDDVAVTRSVVHATRALADGIITDLPARRAYIADNVVVGTTPWRESSLGADGANLGEGILVTGPGHVVEHNLVRGFRDDISLLEDQRPETQYAIDIEGNDIRQAGDDAVEADFCAHDCRVVGNRVTDAFVAFSSQPGLGGPTYFARNAAYNIAHVAFKLYRGSTGDVLLHNTVVKGGDALGIYAGVPVRRVLSRDNLLIGGPGGTFNGWENGSGRVIDAHGDGVPGVGVEVLDLTVFGQQTSSSAGRGIVSWLVYCEELLQPDRERGSVVTQTNEKGEFAIGGLLDREYTLFAADAQTLRRVELEGVRGGARGVEVRMPAAAELTHVAGRVVGRDGTPIPGATVCATFSRPGPNQHTTPDVVTDASGAFDLGALETESLGFRVLGDHLFVVFWRPLGAGEDPGRLELVVSRRAFVQLDLSERPGFADHFAPLDAKGETRGVMLFMGNAIAFPEQIEMEGDKSDVVAVEEDTRLLALWKDGKEVARVPVNAVAGETVVVKP